jgi:hypothetical protein
MRPSILARVAAAAAFAALGTLAPAASGQDAKPTGGGAPKAPTLSPAEQYSARLPEVMVLVGARLESAANFAWSNDLKQTAVDLYRKVLEYDPENRKAKENLGWEKKDGAWVANEKKQNALADLEDTTKGEKKRGEFEKKLREAELGAGKLLAELGDLAYRAGDEESAKAHWKVALRFDDQNALANEKSGNKKIDGKWFTGRALAHKEFDKVYKASLDKVRKLDLKVVSCDETTGIAEAAKIQVKRYKSANFRIESTLPDVELRETLLWMERARVFFLELYQVPERLLDYGADPIVFVLVSTAAQKDQLIDACGAIPDKEKSFKKKFTSIAVTSRLTLAFHQNAESAQRNSIHTATHSFTRDSFGNHAPWLGEAIANSVSAAVKRADLHVCFSGEGSTGGIHLENMSLEQAPKELRDWVQAGKDTATSEFTKLPADGLNSLQIAKSWSLVMYLLETDRAQAREYFAAAGQGTGGDASKDAKILGQYFPDFKTWKDLDAAWREWAVDVYKP